MAECDQKKYDFTGQISEHQLPKDEESAAGSVTPSLVVEEGYVREGKEGRNGEIEYRTCSWQKVRNFSRLS